jgi:hypothetical protein
MTGKAFLFWACCGLSALGSGQALAQSTTVSAPLLCRAAGTIGDGRYKATVKVFNHSSYSRNTYTLVVEVRNDRVVSIEFDNGGSIHDGYNNSGYRYSGGTLQFERDYGGSVRAATATVTQVLDNGSYRTYDIRIE